MTTCVSGQQELIHQTEEHRLRVLHVLPALYRGGMETAFLRLLETFNNPSEQGQTKTSIAHAVCILRDGETDMLQMSHSLSPTFVLHGKRGCWKALRKIINDFKPDLAHARSTGSWLDATLATRGVPRTRLLLSFHGLVSLKPPGWRKKLANRWCLQHADAAMTVTRSAADMLIENYKIPAPKIFVCPNGVNTTTFHPANNAQEIENTRRSLGLAENAFPVICVANLLPVKGLDILLKAWSQIAAAHPQAHLLLVGEGALRQSLQQLAEELGITSTVSFLGRRQDIPALLRASRLFVLPSRYEGHSNAILEAAATALPIITSDVGGTREMIRHQQNGWLVKPDDPHALATQILSAMQDAHVRRQLGRNARKDTLARFSPQNCLAMYRDLYTRLAPAPETVIPSTEEAALCAG